MSGPSWEAVFSYLEAGETIIGIDEVGRGAWAGPVVASAVILPPLAAIPGLADSKVLTPRQRHLISRVIRREAIAVGIGWVAAPEVDRRGLSWAVRESGLRALASVATPAGPYRVILDGSHNYLSPSYPAIALIKADAAVTPVSAASVVAKVARDNYMRHISRRLPAYHFDRHKGYGTSAHMEALRVHGPSDAHRKSVRPVASRIGAL